MNHKEIAERLIEWHDPEQRLLPWRNAAAGFRAPYAVWISEIMAQQTRLETVADYFVRWMERFPTIEALAAADQQDVLTIWQGLGYYARARNLHKAAQQVIADHDGVLPNNRVDLLKLPGIGEYTAGAILSMAFAKPEPVLDGNVKRVLSRLADVAEPVDERATIKAMWAVARDLVEAAPDGSAGALNEALMEFGAKLCTPTSPRCLICPLVAHCLAAQNGTQHERPVMLPKKKVPHFDVAAGVVWQGDPFESKLLIAQRPQDGMLGGLWEFPGGKEEEADGGLEACLRRELVEELAIRVAVGEQIATVKHAYTHFKITLVAFHARFLGGAGDHADPQAIGCADWRWIDFSELDDFPFPVTDRKVIDALHKEYDKMRGSKR